MAALRFIGMEGLFTSPLVCFELAEAAALNPLLLAETAARRAAEAGMHRSNQGGWHSADDLFRRPEPATRALAALIRDAVLAAMQQVAPSFDAARAEMQLEGWINVNGPGAFNAPHEHPTWAWSGTYYVSIPEDTEERSGIIEFLDPRGDVSAFYPRRPQTFQPKARFRPKPGALILFPSFLSHWVYPNASAEERVSVAFNARIVEGAAG